MQKSPRKTLTAPIRRVRFVWVALFFCLWAGAIGFRLIWLQLVRHSEFTERAQKQQQRTFEVAPRRGRRLGRGLLRAAAGGALLVRSAVRREREGQDQEGGEEAHGVSGPTI